MMIRHILLLRPRPDVAPAEIDEVFGRIREVGARLPGALDVTFGPSRSPEDLERGYQYGLVVDFRDWDSLRAYAEDDEHRAVGAVIQSLAAGGIAGLLVVDLDLQ